MRRLVIAMISGCTLLAAGCRLFERDAVVYQPYPQYQYQAPVCCQPCQPVCAPATVQCAPIAAQPLQPTARPVLGSR